MIVMFSSFLSPHIKPLCDEIYNLSNRNFIYVECFHLSEERRKMGYAFDKDLPYLKNLTGDLQRQIELANKAECVIINTGSANIEIVRQRLKDNKLTFYMNERIFKRGLLKLLDPRLWKMVYFNIKFHNKNTYLLCMGRYVRRDFEAIGFHKNRSFKFGYFPKKTENFAENKFDNEVKRLVWVARMIDWKRPLFAIKVVKRLNQKEKAYHLDMLGDGPLLEKVRKYIKKNNIDNMITLHGNMDNSIVREYMCDSYALFFTSNKREGWGAVANEALGVGTPVFASEKIGCTQYLLQDNVNSILFRTNSVKDAVSRIKKVSQQDYNRICKNTTVTLDVWNEKEAAKRFMTVLEAISKEGKSSVAFDNGPMSKA